MRTFITLITLTPALLCARAATTEPVVVKEKPPYELWYTGTLLAATSVNISAIEPFVTFAGIYGDYASNWKLKGAETIWSISPQIDFQFTLTKKIGVEIYAGFVSNFRGGQKATHFIDTFLLLGYQVSTDQENSWVPNCRFYVVGTFPSGKYDRLDAKKRGIDETGQGAYFVGPELAFSKTFKLPCHFFNLYWSLSYYFPTYAHVKGLNVFGGGQGTRGKIRPGQSLQALLSFEYSLPCNWVFAFDSQLVYQRATSRFKGTSGTLPTGLAANVGLKSSYEISIAPQIEYNFDDDNGILFGAWGTVAGRNTKAFASLFFAYVHIF